jgi:hypothetical protein
MASVMKKSTASKSRSPRAHGSLDEYGYPSGMVWCPMKMSGMALMKCAEMQKNLGCGTLKQFKFLTTSKPGVVPFHWPWLRRSRECSERAGEKEVRELRVALSPLKLVKKSRKNSADQCPECGRRKMLNARRCRHCWRCREDK